MHKNRLSDEYPLDNSRCLRIIMHMKYIMMQGGTTMKHTDIKKIVLAYSGGLDTSIIIP